MAMKKKEENGAASNVLREVGRLLGIGCLIKRVENLPVINERLKEVDEEINRRLSEEDISGMGQSRAASGGARRGMPGPAPGHPTVRTRVKRPPQREREPDVFDEGNYLLVVAEMPGMEYSDFTISLKGDRLLISIEKEAMAYRKILKLPCAPAGQVVKTYKNGVLEIRLNK